MAELGTTSDPKELIPGDPEKITTTADELRTRAKTMENVADDLGGVRVPSWSGKASNAFWDTFSPEKNNWLRGYDALESAAKTLDRQSSAVSVAQGKASEAIDLWEKGRQATQQAFGAVASPVSETQSGTGATGSPLNDPGEKLRQEATEILDRARSQLKEISRAHAAAIDDQGGKGDDAPGWLTGPAQFVDEKGPHKVATDLTERNDWIDRARDGQQRTKHGTYNGGLGQRTDPRATMTLLGGKANAELFKTDVQGATQLGDATLGGKLEAKAASTEASATAGVTDQGVTAGAKANANLVEGSAKGSLQYGVAEVGGTAKGSVGAEAHANASIGKDGLNAQAGGFAGAKAEGEAHADVGGVGIGARGEAWAGVGADAGVTAGKNDDGTWTIGGEVGAGLGVGGKVSAEVTIDPEKIGDTASDAAGALNPFD